MKKNVNPIVFVTALLVVGVVIYGVFQSLTQGNGTSNPETANRIPEQARQRGMVGPAGGNSGDAGSRNNNGKTKSGPANETKQTDTSNAGTSTGAPATR